MVTMVKQEYIPANELTATVLPPPQGGVKRERPNDDHDNGESQQRRVSQRTFHDDNAAFNHVAFVAEYLKTIGCTDNDHSLINAATQEFLISFHGKDHRVVEEQQLFLRLGGPHAMLSMMSRHQDSEDLLKYGMEILIRATFHFRESKKVVAELGGIQAILGAMAKCPLSRTLHLKGMEAIGTLCGLRPHANLFFL